MTNEPIKTSYGEAQPEQRSGALPYPTEVIDNLCESLSFEGADREYVHNLFKRHELGAATKPERLLPPMLLALASQLPLQLNVNCGSEMSIDAEVLWPESGPLPIFERVRRKVGSEPEAAWSLTYSLCLPVGLVPDNGLLQRAAALVRAITSRAPLDQCETLLLAASSLYDDIPQTSAAWTDAAALAGRRLPDERKTFAAKAWREISDWISTALDHDRQIVFLVPLVSASEAPDLPGPNDATLSPLQLLEIADAARETSK